MEPISTAAAALAQLVVQAIKSFLPQTPEDKLREIELSIQQQVIANEVFKAQIAVNVAEAANPNRKWVTWRECIGYILVCALAYQWIALPILSLLAQTAGSPIILEKLYTVDMLDVLYLMGGMLGLDVGPIIANKVRGVRK